MSSEKNVRTFKELQEVDAVVAGLYNKNPKLKDSKFGYAYKKFVDKNYVPVVTEFNDELTSLRVQHALEDPNTKEILIDRMNPRGFKYTKTSLITLMQEEKKLSDRWNIKEITVIPFLSASVPEEVTEEEATMLAGLVL